MLNLSGKIIRRSNGPTTRALGNEYKTQQKRTYLWRKKGGTHYIFVPTADLVEDEFVNSSLRQSGQRDDEIREFINTHAAVV